MTEQQLDDLRGAAKTIGYIARDTAKLRNNPDYREDIARHTDFQQELLLIETKLQCMADALLDMADRNSGV